MDENYDIFKIDMYRYKAEQYGLSLQEYMLYLILEKLDDLSVTAFLEE